MFSITRDLDFQGEVNLPLCTRSVARSSVHRCVYEVMIGALVESYGLIGCVVRKLALLAFETSLFLSRPSRDISKRLTHQPPVRVHTRLNEGACPRKRSAMADGLRVVGKWF